MDDKSGTKTDDLHSSGTPMIDFYGTKTAPLQKLEQEHVTHPAQAEKLPRMQEQEIREAIKIHSPGVVKEIYDVVVRQMQYEQGRQGRLDAKANSLLAANGLSLTILFTFGVQVLTKVDKAYALSLVIILWLTVAMGLFSGTCAAWALLIREYKMINERDLFDANVLANIDEHSADESDSSEDDSVKVSIFKRHHIPQMWSIVQTQVRVHDKKASIVTKGQCFFLFFLFGIAVISLITATIFRNVGQA